MFYIDAFNSLPHTHHGNNKKQYLNCFVHMRLWELFSGTGSVARVAQDLGFSVIPLDLKDADANQDILSWDYKEFGVG